jgi:ATP-binding cassette subfamily F protein uup
MLEDFLMEFPGCIIIVTHDRYFMDKIVDHLFVFEGEGQIKDFIGDYSDYRAEQKEQEEERRREEKKKEKQSKKQEKPSSAGSQLTYEQRKKMNRLEKEISKLEEKKAQITEQFNQTGLDPEKIEGLSKELAEVKEQIEEKELQWMELAELA